MAIRCGNHTTPTYHATVNAVRACYRTNDSVNYHRSLTEVAKKFQMKAQIQAWLTRYDIFIDPTVKTQEALNAECDRVAAKYHAAMLNDHEQAIKENEAWDRFEECLDRAEAARG